LAPPVSPNSIESVAQPPAPTTEPPRAVRDLERLVERDVKLRREFSAGAVQTPRHGKTRPTVLVIDDAPDALTLLSIYLSKTGYQVVTASSAEDGLAKLRHHQIDAIVLDAKLPGASGAHVCRVLQEDAAYAKRRDVPVIVYTAYPDDFPPEVRAEWQAADYVVKSGDMLPLITALVRHTNVGEPR
jgi:CheY-like chemotaxis protein